MYVHIGEETIVRASDIIAIIDKESIYGSQQAGEFIKINDHQIVSLAKGSFKSIVITKNEIYYSSLTSITLKKRAAGKSIVQEY